MKTRKFLFMALLCGTLVLSACSFGQQSKKKSDDEDAADNFKEGDYRGKEGATQLSQEEWNQAFSFEETIMHRSVKVVFDQTYTGRTESFTTEIEHGKLKLTSSYESETNVFYVGVDNITSDGEIEYTEYYQDHDTWYKQSSSADLDYLAEDLSEDLGIVEYKYSDFTYDSSSKTYKCNTFEGEISEDLSSDPVQVEITIKDGFPVKAELTSPDTTDHLTVTYSDYGKVKVTLPTVKQNDTSSSPIKDSSQSQSSFELGTEITYAQLMDAFYSRPTANFNHVELILSNGSETMTSSANLVDGEWVETDGSTSIQFSSFILTESDMLELPSSTSAGVLSYYHKGNQYVISNVEPEVTYIIYLSEYFYLCSEVLIQNGQSTEAINLVWSRR